VGEFSYVLSLKQLSTKQPMDVMNGKLLKWPLTLLVLAVVVFSCTPWDDGPGSIPNEVEGYKPVYMPKTAAYTVSAEAPKPLLKPGKIYIYHGLLFVVDRLKGIHVINNQDPSNPTSIAFLNVPGCNDVAVNGGMLYADNVTDLVVFDITDPLNISYKERLKGVFPQGLQLFPEMANNQYFECVDTTKGVVIDWELTTLKQPKCYK